MDRLWQDCRLALRSLKKSPGVSILIGGSVAVAVAGNATVFGLVNGLLFRPLPFDAPHEITLVGARAEGIPLGSTPQPASAADFLDLRDHQTSFREMAAFRPLQVGLDRTSGEPQRLTAAAVTPEFFDVLGVAPHGGRFFVADEGVPGNHQVAVVSHELWQRRLGGGEDLLGSTLRLDGEPHEVVGILREGFEFILPGIDLYLPLALARGQAEGHRRDVLAVGRRRPGVSDAAAAAEVSTVLRRLAAERSEVPGQGYVADVRNLRRDLPGPRARFFLGLVQSVLLGVLLIASANSANLLLARGQARRREIAIRSALGARRRHVTSLLMTESLMLALLAGAAGTILGWIGIRVARSAFDHLFPSFWLPVLDLRVVAFSLGVTLLGGLLFGLAPVLQTTRLDLLPALRDGAAATMGGQRRSFLSDGLVVAELTLALIFLSIAGILIRTFHHMQTVDPGFDTTRVLTLEVRLPGTGAAAPALDASAERLRDRLARLPGVSGVVLSDSPLRSLRPNRDPLILDTRPPSGDEPPPLAIRMALGAGGFEALQVPLRRGRFFDETDRAGGPPVTVVNELMARRYWDGEDPLGQKITVLGRSREIVGVVADLRHDLVLSDDFMHAVYLPFSQEPRAEFVVSLTTELEPGTLAPAVRRTLRDLEPMATVSNLRTLEAALDEAWKGQRLMGDLLRFFGALALALAALGTYGVLAHAVVRRTREIGVRIALGAGRRQILLMFARRGLGIAAAGLLLGLPLVWAASRLITASARGFQAADAGAVASVSAVLVGAILLAALVPARRAASIDPIRALRWE